MRESLSGKRNRSGFTLNNTAQIILSGNTFFDTLEKLIDSAVHEIHFQTYIFEEDETGKRIADALMRAARREVRIFMLIDAFGSNSLTTAFINKMKAERIEIRLFGKLFKEGRFHIGRRLHRKVMVIDGVTSVVSGINISNNYNSFPGSPAWLDFSIVVQGEVSKKIRHICNQSFLKIRFGKRSVKLREHVQEQVHRFKRHVKMRVRENDWKFGRNLVARSYYQIIRQAQESLIIVGGYFLPGRRGKNMLRKASARGVEIKLIVAERSDVGLMRTAMLYLYDWLLRNQVRIFEYLPSNVHGKTIVADKKRISIGSYDLNTLSTYSNIELNLDVDDQELAGFLHEQLEAIIEKDCKEITKESFRTRSGIRRRFSRWLAYRLVKSLFILSIWLTKSNKKDMFQQ